MNCVRPEGVKVKKRWDSEPNNDELTEVWESGFKLSSSSLSRLSSLTSPWVSKILSSWANILLITVFLVLE